MKLKEGNKGFSLIILLIAVLVIAFIFFAGEGILERYKGDRVKKEEQKEAIEDQLQNIQGNLEDYNKQIQKELN